MIKKLLEVRKLIKQKKPTFARQDSWKYLRLNTGWRAGKGRHNKYRLTRRGKTNPTPSYSVPLLIKGFHACGKKEIMINKISDLESVDASNEVARLSATIGLKKRIEIVKIAEKSKVRILNPGVQTLKAIKVARKKEKMDNKKKTKVDKKE